MTPEVILAILLTFPPQRPPVPKVSCIATNHPETLVTHNADGTAKVEEIDDWLVSCTITVGEKKVYDGQLVLPHPTEFHEAMVAIDEFRRVKAGVILKEKKL